MAAVVDKNEAAAKFSSQVDEHIAQATNRIRAHDLMFGGLVLLVLVLGYATAAVLLDKSLGLAEWVRQVSLTAFLILLGGSAYLTVLSPLRKHINPLYAARQVERTIDDSKNSVTGYVDAQQKGNLNPTVRAALANRAARAAAEADVNRAVDHRSLMYLGGAAIALVLALVVLFFLYRPAQFSSLLGRAFVPFTSDPIVSQTQLQLVKPDPAEPTITTGQSISVGVHVGGRVPRSDGADKVRLLVRHNRADPNYEELPMVPAPGATNRDFELRVPDYLVQNGFWYKVAGGDDVTPEYKVTVRSLPMFTGDFAATYVYPKYLRRATETANDPVIRAYRGTTVTLIARTNREVRDGLMTIEPGGTRVVGTPAAGKPDSLRFEFKLAESGKYQLTFNATNGERSADAFASIITVDSDQAPIVVITKPEEDEPTELPANGLLKVDGKIHDDFGIDTVTLKMKLVGPVERPLPDVPYLNGKVPSFRRKEEKDETYPTNLTYKGSVDLAKLTKDANGRSLKLEENGVIEYWLEAADNCTEPKANVGRSTARRVRLTPPKTEAADQQNLDKEKGTRKDEEKNHDAEQQKNLEKEKRDQNQKKEQNGQPGKQDGQPEPKPGGGGEKDGKKPDSKQGGTKNEAGGDTPPEKGPENGQPEPKKGDKNAGTGDMNDPKPPMDMNDQPKSPDQKNGSGQKGATEQKNENPDPNAIDKTAEDLNKDLKQEKQSAGGGKPNPTANERDRTDPADAKRQPPMDNMGGMGGDAAPKPEPKDPMGGNPMDKGNQAPAEGKNQGDTKKGEDAATPKPDSPDKGAKNEGASEERSAPAGGSVGDEKKQPKEPPPQPKDPNAKQEKDPASGSTGKGASQNKDQAGAQDAQSKDPAAGAASGPKPPVKEPNRGAEKPQPQPQPNAPENSPEKGDADAGAGKAQQPPPAGNSKNPPKGDKAPPKGDMADSGTGMDAEPKGSDGANDPKSPNGNGAADVKPDDSKKGPMGGTGDKGGEKGRDKPQPKEDGKPSAGGGDNNAPKKQLGEQERKELEQAANDLNSPDEKKRDAARDKLDKAVGKDKREELEQLGKDLNSKDEKKQQAAREKLDQLRKDAAGGKDDKQEPKDGDGGKLDEQQKKDIKDAVNDLKSGDPNKKREAEKKLDKAIGEQNRKDVEQALEDQNSDDPKKQDAANQKLKDLKDKLDGKQGEPEGKGKKPTAEELNELMKKAQDLNSMDEKARQQAEKDLDQKIGEENRKKLQEEMKNKKTETPKDAEAMKQKLKEWAEGPGRGADLIGATEDDKKNRAKTGELTLEEFEKNKDWIKNKKGWTEEEYQKFMEGYRKRVEDWAKEAERPAEKPVAPMPGDKKDSTFTPGNSSGRVEGMTGPVGPASGGGATVAPPGFEDARRKFEEALKKKP
jgi:hypothetical protein